MDVFKNEYVEFWVEDSVLFSKYKKGVLLGLKEAKDVIELRHKISNNTGQYWCMDIQGIRGFDKEARDYVDNYGQDFVLACAVLVDSHLNKFMVNTYLKLKPPKVPMKLFINKEDAVRWLLEIKSKNEYL